MKNSILMTRENQVAAITFNRPEKKNACNREMLSYFAQLCEEINADDSIHIVLIKGMGPSFTIGYDLDELYQDIDIFSSEALSFVRQFNSCILMLREMTKVVIVTVQGAAIGIGMCLVLAADLVIASRNATFSLGFNRLGLPPIGAASYLLPRVLGAKHTMELLMMPRILDAQTALSMGLVNWVVSQEELHSKTEEVIRNLEYTSCITLNQTKQLINSSYQQKLTTQLEFEAEAFVRCVNTDTFKTALHTVINQQVSKIEEKQS